MNPGGASFSLGAARDEYFAWGARHHLLAVAALGLLVLARWHAPLFHAGPLLDEVVYLEGFHEAAAGKTPYYPGTLYIYPPSSAEVGGFLLREMGEAGCLAALRALNFAGLLLTVWCSAAFWPMAMANRFVLAAVLAVTMPGFAFGMNWGNLSLAGAGLLLAGLLVWPRRPLGAAGFFALATLVKPLGPGGLALLALHRPATGAPLHRKAVLATCAGGFLVAAATLASPYWRDFLGMRHFSEATPHTFSSRRLLLSLGFGEVDAVLVAALVLVPMVLIARRSPLGDTFASLLAVVGATLTAPIWWIHSAVFSLPLQGAAVAVAWRRAGGDRRRRLEAILVTGVALLGQSFVGIKALRHETWVLPWAIALPLLAPLVLFLYLRRAACPSSGQNQHRDAG